MSRVLLKDLNKIFGHVVAVRDLTLEIHQGEFFSLLGPSGCGKTTTLRMIAGFELPTSGQILFNERDVTFLKPDRRNTGMVFQNYALFPHMTVFENVAFGLRARKVEKPEIQRRVQGALNLVDLRNFGARKVTELSGGQQQRVALARAIVIEPNILLLDEPLSNLDAKLREETRDEIRALQQRLGITTVYVTHDQEEALALSDRIAVMNDGICHQVGSPVAIYENPEDEFVARFVGNSNILAATVIKRDDGAVVEINPQWQLMLENVNSHIEHGQKVSISIRPESIHLVDNSATGDNVVSGIVTSVQFSGSIVDYEIDLGGDKVQVRRLAERQRPIVKRDEKVGVQIAPSDITILK